MDPLAQNTKKQAQNNRGAQPVSDLVSNLLDPIIERRAGMTMDLMAAWSEIAGEKHAAHSRPEKLNWPRQASDDDPFEPATLVIACEGHHALFLQHDTSAIMSSVNTYFGFAAVVHIKIVQKPLPVREQRKLRARADLPVEDRRDLDALLADITDPDLKHALEKMGKAVFSRRSQ